MNCNLASQAGKASVVHGKVKITLDIPVFHLLPVSPQIQETVGNNIPGLFLVVHIRKSYPLVKRAG